MTEPLSSLQPDRLMQHMQVLCKSIGARPACSLQERRAAEYVQVMLRSIGIEQIAVQSFRSHVSLGAQSVPVLALAVLATLIGHKRTGKLLAAKLSALSAFNLRGILTAKPPFFQPLVALGNSQNVVATIAPRSAVKRRVYLIGHLDSGKQRFTLPTESPELLKPLTTLTISALFLNALIQLRRAILPKARRGLWDAIFAALSFGALLSQLNDERQPFVEGANDNASAVSVLLGLAEALSATPLEHTQVTLLFTGCADVGAIGMARYLEAFQPPRFNSYFIAFEMVGSGNLCYVVKHGVTAFGQYAPDPDLLTFARCAAREHPQVAGREMLTLDEIAVLTRLGYKGLCIAGYNQEGGLPSWHRTSDTLDQIQAGTLSRAAHFGYTLLQTIDRSA
ncbi:MAG: M28 family metallopeptidase [Anaerolineae bacterium]|nr:M28 family metallopeptidase [Anaerolineae bacterium]